ncbi:MAG: CHAT domain-containing protein [Ktedonobacteraceae bacterium]
MGNYEQAERLLQQTLDIRRAALGEQHPEVAISLNNLALLYKLVGNYTQGESLYQQALKTWRMALGEEHPHVADALDNLATLYTAMGNYAQAEPLLWQALAIRRKTLGKEHPDVALSLNNLANLYVATDRTVEALTIKEEATAIEDKMIGQIFSIGSERQRMAYLATFQVNFDIFLSLVLQHLSLSRMAVQAALNVVLRRKAIGAEALAAQRDAVLSGRYPGLAPKLRELTTLRTQIVQKTLAGPGPEGILVHQQLLADWTVQKEQLEAELARQIPEMNLAQKLLDADQRRVAKALPQDTALIEFVRFPIYDFKAIPARGEARWKPAHYLAFVLIAQEQEFQLIDLGEADIIDTMIMRFRESITHEVESGVDRQLKFVPVSSHAVTSLGRGSLLRKALFDPLLIALNGRKRLFLASDGDLNRLPFEVLPVDNKGYLIDEYQLSYLSTGRDLLRFEDFSPGQGAAVLVVADPDFDLSSDSVSRPEVGAQREDRVSRDLHRNGLHFDRLLGTKIEGEQIASLLGVQPLLQGEALEKRLKECRSPNILHIATHGFFLPDQGHALDGERPDWEAMSTGANSRLEQFLEQHVENPLLRSGLALAGINTWSRGGSIPLEAEDGILTAEDVSELDLLATEMVVLSACETGLGEVHVGEGVFGLRRAFILAGAKTLVMSLWKVSDQQTQELMKEFYYRLLAGRPRVDALREAELAMRTKYPHPYYWGAFICQGDPGPLSPYRLEARSDITSHEPTKPNDRVD